MAKKAKTAPPHKITTGPDRVSVKLHPAGDEHDEVEVGVTYEMVASSTGMRLSSGILMRYHFPDGAILGNPLEAWEQAQAEAVRTLQAMARAVKAKKPPASIAG